MAKEPENKATEGQAKRKTEYRSENGPVVAGSLVETDRFAEARVQVSPNGVKVVRAYNNKPELVEALKAAAASGEPTLFRGNPLGSKAKNNVHMAINSINEPLAIEARIHNAFHSDPTKQPAVNGYMIQTITPPSGKSFTKGVPFRAFGEAAVALSGLKAGDVITADAREVVNKREKDGETFYVDALEITGNVSIGEPEARKTNEAAEPAPAPEPDTEAYAPQTSTSDFDDEIPF